jgi:hypothetical protein
MKRRKFITLLGGAAVTAGGRGGLTGKSAA